jgi:hypothetical protein
MPSKIGCGDESRTRIISFTRRALWNQLSYAANWWTGRDSNPHEKFARLLCCQLHHQPKMWRLWVDSNHQPFAYETKALPIELHSQVNRRRRFASDIALEARGGVEPRAFPPDSYRFGLEDRCRGRGPRCDQDSSLNLLEAMVRFELTRCCLRDSRSTSWSYIALLDSWSGREAEVPLRTPRSRAVTVLQG